MFCYQCEQTARGVSCEKMGVCGKQPDVAALQDLLTHAMKGLALAAVEGRKVGVNDRVTNVSTVEAMFSTLTNVNFDPADVAAFVRRAVALRDALKAKVKAAGGKTEFAKDSANFMPGSTIEAMVAQGERSA